MKRFTWLLMVIAVIAILIILLSAQASVLAKTAESLASSVAVITVQDPQVLTGTIDGSLVVSEGGELTLLGMAKQDVIIEDGGVAYIHGIVGKNVLNRGGKVEVYGVIGGYVYTDFGGNTQIDPNALIVATPPAATPTPLPTATPLPDTPVATASPPTPNPTATPPPASGLTDLSVSLYRTASTTVDRTAYEEIFAHFADAIYEMSNGIHKVRNVIIYENGAHANKADVVWVDNTWPRAYINGYSVAGYPIYMGDQFNTHDFLTERRCAGYALAHEWGHYYYGVYDEYQPTTDRGCQPRDLSCPRMDDKPVEDSIMNNQWIACKEDDFAWLNLSVPRNQTQDNAQYRVYNASAWETLSRPTSQDPRQAALLAVRPRTYFSEFSAISFSNNQEASIELLDSSARMQARSELNILWNTEEMSSDTLDTSAPASSQSASLFGDDYAGSVASVLGSELNYPDPLIVVAKVVNRVPIAKVDVRAGLLRPTGEITSLTLLDNGDPPDVLANDGLYSGLVPYNQKGEYKIFVTFNNLGNTAEFTEASFEYAPGPGGEVEDIAAEPVGENFYAVGDTTVFLRDVIPDDHANVITEATMLSTDNVDTPGRIDYAADLDMFEILSLSEGKLILRVSDLAFDMQPTVKIWKNDGATLIKELDLDLNSEGYLFIPLDFEAGEPLYAAVSHLDPNAKRGFYKISVGPALPNDTESPPLNLLLVMLSVIGGLTTIVLLYVLLRSRPTEQHVSAPPRRSGSFPIQQLTKATKKSNGHSLYKSAKEKGSFEKDESTEKDN